MSRITTDQAISEGWFTPNQNGGLCECVTCGLPAPPAKQSSRRDGTVKGEATHFRKGHKARLPEYQVKLTEARRANPVARANQIASATTHGRSQERTGAYTSWRAMKSRCAVTDPTSRDWLSYGSRGITVCDRWLKFENFLEDMGERPEWATGGIDRIDNAGNYEPGNCRWATASEQAYNRRSRGVSLRESS